MSNSFSVCAPTWLPLAGDAAAPLLGLPNCGTSAPLLLLAPLLLAGLDQPAAVPFVTSAKGTRCRFPGVLVAALGAPPDGPAAAQDTLRALLSCPLPGRCWSQPGCIGFCRLTGKGASGCPVRAATPPAAPEAPTAHSPKGLGTRDMVEVVPWLAGVYL